MNFFHLIKPDFIPTYLDQDDVIVVLKERALQYILLGSSLSGIFAYGYTLISNIQNQLWFRTGLFTLVFISLLFLTLLRNTSYTWKAYAFIFTSHLLGTFFIIQNGINSSAISLLFLLPLISVLFIDKKFARFIAVIEVATISFSGWLISSNKALLISLSNPTNLSDHTNWMFTAALFAIFSFLAINAVSIFITGVQSITESQKLLIGELRNKRASLEERLKEETHKYDSKINSLTLASHFVSETHQITELNQFLQKSVEFICEHYGFYHARIFLIDEPKEKAILMAASGDTGKILVDKGYHIKITEGSLVGYAIDRVEPRITLNFLEKSPQNENEILPNTISEMAIPIKIGNEVLGAVDIHSDETQKLTADSITLIQPIIDQLTLMIEKIKVIQEIRSDFEILETSVRQLTQKNWQQYLQSSKTRYAYKFKKDKIESDFRESEETIQAYQLKNSIQVTKKSETADKNISIVAVPIKLRNEVLGIMNIQFETEVVPEETKRLLNEVVDRLAIALDNARLVEEIQMRSERDHLVTEITSKIRGESTMDNILRTAAIEIGRSLGISDVVVQLKPNRKIE